MQRHRKYISAHGNLLKSSVIAAHWIMDNDITE